MAKPIETSGFLPLFAPFHFSALKQDMENIMEIFLVKPQYIVVFAVDKPRRVWYTGKAR
ncbi:MAG: hypothetical protein IKU51_06495 [Clostridia bacterium]|nr:hypothetical protein [Clostridia bacterium]